MSEAVVRIAARGEGVTADGRHVLLAVPGDIVGNDGTIVRGPHHADPPCRHFPQCGGCQLQHVDDVAYANYLSDRITGALKAQGIAPPDITVPHLSRPMTRRRASLRGERRGKSVLLGFNEGQSNRIVDMRECLILLPALFAIVAPLRTLLGQLLGDRGRATVVMTRADQGVDLLLGGFEGAGLSAAEALQTFARVHGLARLSLDEGYGPEALYAPERVTITLGGVAVALPENAFLQATCEGERALVAAVAGALEGSVDRLDLFAGLGTFALSCGARLAVEGSRDAALALKASGRMAVEHRDLFRRPVTSPELAAFDGLVLDPPRAGAIEQVKEIAQSRVRRIAYVSCNPATFARDAKLLVDGGYVLTGIVPVGQFRWSTHVELAGSFIRR